MQGRGVLGAVGWAGGPSLFPVPGEEIRTPLILLLPWEGDDLDAHNVLRRHVLKYHAPQSLWNFTQKTLRCPGLSGSGGIEGVLQPMCTPPRQGRGILGRTVVLPARTVPQLMYAGHIATKPPPQGYCFIPD